MNSIWEGSGNVAALDVLRAIGQGAEGLPAFLDECELAVGADRRLDAHLGLCARGRLLGRIGLRGNGRLNDTEFSARRLVEQLAVGLAVTLVIRRTTRRGRCVLRRADGRRAGRVYGTLPAGVDAAAIVDRALPA